MDETRVKRARFRAWRRGFLEADLILGPFADAHASNFDDHELGRFEHLLEQNDHDLWTWIRGAAPIPPAFDDDLMRKLQDFLRAGCGPRRE
ncbi:MAG: FAD assembly factor SdhE [Caulobacteraceae bacterium]